MTDEEKLEALYGYSELLDEAKAVVSGQPYVHTPVEFSLKPAEVPVEETDEEDLKALVEGCRRCSLCESRTHAVYGMGSEHPLVMVVGEGPGYNEDMQGLPFVGRSGQFLDQWLSPIGLSRKTNVYIANIVKCRPPENRTPAQDEVAACLPYLKRQIKLRQPKLLLLCGSTAAHALLGRMEGVGRLRGQVFSFDGIPTIVTYHPAAVLRNMDLKKDVWHDVKLVASRLGLKILRGK